MKRLTLRSTFVATLLLACVLAPTFAAEATTRFVDAATGDDTTNDCSALASPCKTITHALTQAVANDTISVAAGTYNLALGETFPLVIAVNLTLTGAGAPTTIIDATGANTRVITVNVGVTAAISGVTITGGGVSCIGSCIVTGAGLLNNGTLTLTASTVSGNTASATASVSGNCVAQGGGLAYADFLSPPGVVVTASTVSNNTASCTNSQGTCVAEGGGLYSMITGTSAPPDPHGHDHRESARGGRLRGLHHLERLQPRQRQLLRPVRDRGSVGSRPAARALAEQRRPDRDARAPHREPCDRRGHERLPAAYH